MVGGGPLKCTCERAANISQVRGRDENREPALTRLPRLQIVPSDETTKPRALIAKEEPNCVFTNTWEK